MRVSASSQEGLDAFAERRKPDFDAARAREARASGNRGGGPDDALR
jgi:hypothetical protein